MRLHITCEAHAERTQHEHVCHLILLSNTKSAVVRTIDTTGVLVEEYRIDLFFFIKVHCPDPGFIHNSSKVGFLMRCTFTCDVCFFGHLFLLFDLQFSASLRLL